MNHFLADYSLWFGISIVCCLFCCAIIRTLDALEDWRESQRAPLPPATRQSPAAAAGHLRPFSQPAAKGFSRSSDPRRI